MATELGLEVLKYILWEEGLVINHDLHTNENVFEYIRKRKEAGGLDNTKLLIPKTVQQSKIYALLK